MSASIEYTDSNAISFGDPGGAALNNASRCTMSLWRKMWQTDRALLMPAIIEAWVFSSENTSHKTSVQAGGELYTVDSAAWFDTNPEVNSSAACLACIAASSVSSASCAGLVPLMLRVPP